jgi:hypothetical protein
MKGLMAWMVGIPLTLSLVAAPAVAANCDDSDAQYRSSAYWSTGHWPANQTIAVVGAPMTMSNGMRVYLVSDDPAYDLSGAGEFWYLVNDGTAFHATSYRSPAAYVRMTAANHEVVMIPAEYRQDWLAVAAGDRPVRCLTAPRSTLDVDMNTVPSGVVYITPGTPGYDRAQYSSTRYTGAGTQYRAHPRRKAVMHRRTHMVGYTSARRHVVHHRHRVALTSHRRRTTPASYSYAERTTRVEPAENMVATAPVAEVEIKRDEAGPEMFQCNDSWYKMDDGMWSRAESWRGPFVHIKKGMVPREVRMSAKHRSRIDMD